MRKILKALFAIFAVTTLGILLSCTVFAEIYTGDCGADGDNVTYKLDTSTRVLEISGIGEMYNWNYWNGIKSPWNSYIYYVKTVKIFDGVTSIGDDAFMGCSFLTSIAIPDSILKIGYEALSNCSSLANVTIPESVISIGDCAFQNCSSLTSITFETKNTTFGSVIFYDCTNLKNIYLYRNSTADKYFGSSYTKKYLDICRITYDLNGGNGEFEAQTKIGYETVNLNSNIPTKEGFDFIHWKTDGEDTIQLSVSGLESAHNYANDTNDIWTISCPSAKSITLTFDSRTAFDSPEDCLTIYDQNETHLGSFSGTTLAGKSITVHGAVVKLKLTSNGFNTKWGFAVTSATAQCSSTYAPGSPFGLNEDTTLYAVWQEKTYNVFYNANGGSGAPSLQTKYYFSDLDLVTPTKEGYLFIGWKGSDGNTYVQGSTYSTNADITLTAIWQLKTYTITYDANGGENTPESSTKEHFETVNLSEDIPTKYGYNFGGWRGSDGKTYAAGGACSANQNLVLTPIWNPMRVSLIYDANGGNVSPSSKSVYYEDNYGTLATPTRVGYTFANWYTEKDGGSRVSSSTYVNTLENITIFAHWSANSYSVSFDANGGTISNGNKTIVFDSSYGTLPTPMLAGFTFDGWYTAIEGGDLITNDTVVEIAENHTLYARWNSASYLLIFDANGGECEIDSKTITFGTLIGNLPVPTRIGYTFVAWSKTKTTSGAVNAETYYQNTSDTTLYAVWEANTYTVTFDANGGADAPEAQTKKHEIDITISDIIPTKDGFKFKGWATSKAGKIAYLPGDKYVIDSNVTLYAVWEEIKINFGDTNGDAEINIKDVVLFAQYLAGWDVSLDLDAADCNNDGEANIKDIVLLAQHLAGWNVTLG